MHAIAKAPSRAIILLSRVGSEDTGFTWLAFDSIQSVAVESLVILDPFGACLDRKMGSCVGVGKLG